MFGLLSRDEQIIVAVLSKFDEIESAIIFGSRALGNYKKGSDVDLALRGTITTDTVLKVSQLLNDVYPIPYYFDVMNYHTISSEALRKHIDDFGKYIYSNNKRASSL